MKTKKKLIISVVVSVVILFLGMLAFGIWIVYPYYSDPIDIVDKPVSSSNTENEIIVPDTTNEVTKSDSIYKEEVKEDEIINIVICGMDARNYETNSRSDTIILASYNTTKHEVKLVSFMRDTWVELTDRGWNRINSATAYGGTGLLINTLNNNFNLDIQYYVQVKFDDFKKIIDNIGGVEIELNKSEINYINKKLHSEDRDWNNDIKSEPGIINLNGAQALWHCRNRTVGNSDFERTERQRTVMSSMINKVVQIDIGQASKLIFDLRENVRTNIPIDLALRLCDEALLEGSIKIETDRIPYDDMFSYANKSGASVIEIDIEETTEKLHDFLGYTKEEEGLTGIEEVEVVTE